MENEKKRCVHGYIIDRITQVKRKNQKIGQTISVQDLTFPPLHPRLPTCFNGWLNHLDVWRQDAQDFSIVSNASVSANSEIIDIGKTHLCPIFLPQQFGA